MIIKASQRSGARSLANHLMNDISNDHVELHEVRGLIGNSLHAALLEIDGVSKGTRCQQPFFSVSFNPPEGEQVTNDQFDAAFDSFERKLGLFGQPRAVVYHEKEGRRHAHVVWSRIDVEAMKAINLTHFKRKATDISRQLYLEHGWDMPQGLIDKKERDPFQLSNAEWQQYKRNHGLDPKEIKLLCQDAWVHSDNLASFKHALEERNLFLAQGDRRGFVILDQTKKVYSLSRFGGIKTKDLKIRLGNPDQLPSVAKVREKVRAFFNGDILHRITALKKRHKEENKPLLAKKAELVRIQRAERREMFDQQRVKRNIASKEGKDRFRRGVMSLFDKVSGRERRVRLINRKQTEQLKRKQKESRQLMIFRHNQERARLQKDIKKVREKQRRERTQLAQRIFEFRQVQEKEQQRTISRQFDQTSSANIQEKGRNDKSRGESKKSWDRKRPTRTRTRTPK